MKMKSLGMAVAVAILASLTLAVATAAAAEPPTFYECHKAAEVLGKYIGEYNDSSCSEVNAKHEGKWEFTEGTGSEAAVTGSGKGVNFEWAGIGGFSCTAQTVKGAITRPTRLGKLALVFKGCEMTHKKCESTETLGEIKWNALKGELGYLESGHEVGVLLSAETGAFAAEFHCGEEEYRVSGGFIAKITSPINAFTKELDFRLEEVAGRQLPRKLEGGAEQFLTTEFGTGGGFSNEHVETGVATEWATKTAKLELKA